MVLEKDRHLTMLHNRHYLDQAGLVLITIAQQREAFLPFLAFSIAPGC